MLRGLYTGAAGMQAQWLAIDVVSNNLANVNTPAFKRDQTIFKAFPEMLIRRLNDNGTVQFPLGSYDVAPVVGKLGTGVEVNDVYTDFDQGNGIRRTEHDFDLALEGKGFFTILMPDGSHRFTRNGNFQISKEGFLVTKDGYQVLGQSENPIKIKENNIRVDEDGGVFINDEYPNDVLSSHVDREQNSWASAKQIDTLKVVYFHDERGLRKEGNSFYTETEQSGNAFVISREQGRPKVMQGYIEISNVNPIKEMVSMIEVHRGYEANQKSLSAHDRLLEKLVAEVPRV